MCCLYGFHYKDPRVLSISEILKELRVPELKYEITNNQETDQLEEQICDFLEKQAKEFSESSLLKVLAPHIRSYSLSPRIYNALFFCDRLVDVFCRKVDVDEQIKKLLSRWRIPIAKLLIKHPNLLETENNPVFALIDDICVSQQGWTVEPVRISQQLIDRLAEIYDSLINIPGDSPEYCAQLYENWCSDQVAQRERQNKLFERLVKTEQGAATSRYSIEFSRYTLGRLAKGKVLPAEICDFLADQWFEVLRITLLNRTEEDGWESLVSLTERFISIFSQHASKNRDVLFKMAEVLVDDMALASSHSGVKIEDEKWETIQQLLIAVLQTEPIERKPLSIDAPRINFDKESQPSDEALASWVGQWFLFDENQAAGRLKFACYFGDSREILWLNHAGMKSLIMPYETFKQRYSNGTIKPLPQCYAISQVYLETKRGLGKVAQAQLDARERARVKAEQEAEQLKLAKLKALELTRLKEQEAAKLLEEQRTQRAEKSRIEKEQAVLKVISGMTLGSWIAVGSRDGKDKYKLAVRINATDKLIFVDRLGLKKIEIKTPELMQRMITGEIRLLSDGADFDDTLSRVVGRIRVGR